MMTSTQNPEPILVLGATGKTGRRIAQGLTEKGIPVRLGSRSASPSFDWENPAGWDEALQGVRAVYLNYFPDLAVQGAAETVQRFCQCALRHHVQHIVLLSGRGEEEAQRSEEIVKQCGIAWTTLRSSWFNQNFSEAFLRDFVVAGQVTLPVGTVREPFIDADDIAEVALAALTERGHTNQLYEITGPRLLSFAEAVNDIAEASGKNIHFEEIPVNTFVNLLEEHDTPPDMVELLRYLFTEVLDGRNETICDGVQKALGRPPRDFKDYAQEAAASGAW